MLILDNTSQIKTLKLPPITCTLGVFDGVHLGHKKIINTIVNKTKESKGTSLIITFDKHPYSIINPQIHIPLLTSIEHKLIIFESLEVDICMVLKFDKTMASISAEAWVKDILWGELHINTIIIGEDSYFGKDRQGNFNMLSDWSKKLGFKAEKMEKLRMDKTPISSTIIRNTIISGNLISTEKLLGRKYSVYGTHVKGLGLGKDLGFPTFNFETYDQCLPSNGIYAVLLNPAPGKREGTFMPGVANLGIRPSLNIPTKKPVLEVHLLTAPSEIEKITPYSKNIEIVFMEKLRDEIKFGTTDELRTQIKKDVEQTRELFKNQHFSQ